MLFAEQENYPSPINLINEPHYLPIHNWLGRDLHPSSQLNSKLNGLTECKCFTWGTSRTRIRSGLILFLPTSTNTYTELVTWIITVLALNRIEALDSRKWSWIYNFATLAECWKCERSLKKWNYLLHISKKQLFLWRVLDTLSFRNVLYSWVQK